MQDKRESVTEFVAQFGKFLDTRNVPPTNQTTLYRTWSFGLVEETKKLLSESDLSQKGLEKCQQG